MDKVTERLADCKLRGGRRFANLTRTEFIRRTVTAFLEDDMRHQGVTSMDDYGGEWVIKGLGTNYHLNFADFACGFSRYPLEVRRENNRHERALYIGRMLRVAFDGTPTHFLENNFVQCLVNLDSAGPADNDNTVKRSRLERHLRFINRIKAAMEAPNINGQYMPSVYPYDQSDSWTSDPNPLTALGFHVASDQPVYPLDWEHNPEKQEQLSALRVEYTQVFDWLRYEAKERQWAEMHSLLERVGRLVGEIARLMEELREARVVSKIPRSVDDISREIQSIQALVCNRGILLTGEQEQWRRAQEKEARVSWLDFPLKLQLRSDVIQHAQNIQQDTGRLLIYQRQLQELQALLKKKQANAQRPPGKIRWELKQKQSELHNLEKLLRHRYQIEPAAATLVASSSIA
ncbi:hypothetical protein KGQ71_03735 [Patescibacteria group bacterium]|nr:hypothetical protein [Patescibacteria group bacterium]